MNSAEQSDVGIAVGRIAQGLAKLREAFFYDMRVAFKPGLFSRVRTSAETCTPLIACHLYMVTESLSQYLRTETERSCFMTKLAQEVCRSNWQTCLDMLAHYCEAEGGAQILSRISVNISGSLFGTPGDIRKLPMIMDIYSSYSHAVAEVVSEGFNDFECASVHTNWLKAKASADPRYCDTYALNRLIERR